MSLFPTVYVQHGGGPMPLIGRQPDVVASLQKTAASLPRPNFIVVVSAHWESNPVSVLSSPNPPMLYDYGGFPPETYKIKYNAPGHPALAKEIQGMLTAAGVPTALDPNRGYDHGIFVPLMIMYPNADIPVIAVSQPADLSPRTLAVIGRALQPLRARGGLILGSGGSFHSFPEWNRPTPDGPARSREFDRWLQDAVLRNTGDRRLSLLQQWSSAPNARFCHPREEHLTPLIAIAAAGGDDPATLLDNGGVGTYAHSQFAFGQCAQ